MKNRTTTPKGAEGLERWLNDQFPSDDLEAVRPLLELLIRTRKRLDELDHAITSARGADKARLIRLETQLLGRFAGIWRTLGLDSDDGPYRGPGRPSSCDREDI
jgi:hypothetical protein